MSKDTEFCITDKTCHICYKTYAGKSQLYRHLREVHNEYERLNSFYEKDECVYKCLEGCDVSFRFNRDLRHHLNGCHNFNITETIKQFFNLEDFHKWLIQEQECGAKFVKHSGPKNKDKKITYYSCNRSGLYKCKTSNRKRQLKKNGTRKINAGCTSYLKLEENDGACVVTYCDFHYGHKIELDHLPLPLESRAAIVDKLTNGAKLLKINLEKEEIQFESIQRSDLLTQSDIKGLKNFSRSRQGTLALSKSTRENSLGPLFDVKTKGKRETDKEETEVIELQEIDKKGEIKQIEEKEISISDRKNIEIQYVDDTEKNSDTEEDVFGYYVADMLKQIDSNDRISARIQINDILQSFITKDLMRNKEKIITHLRLICKACHSERKFLPEVYRKGLKMLFFQVSQNSIKVLITK